MSAVTINMEADKHLANELSKYSSSFSVMKDIKGLLTQKYLKLKRDGSIEKLEEFDTKMEKCRTYNLISFLCFLVENIEDALKYNEKSLALFPDNIIGLCNRGWFLYKTNQKFGDIGQVCKKLGGAQEDPSNTIVAKAEIAFTYSRLGIQFYKKASLVYHDALAEAKCQPVRQLSDNFEEYICLWSFDMALAQSRLFTTFNVFNASDLEITKKNYTSVCELSRDIINTTMHKSLRSRAYVLLGIVADDIKFEKELFPNQMKSILPEDTKLHLPPDGYFEEAMNLQNNDVFVLERCGQHFGFTSNLDKAIRLLKESISIKASSFAYHHLALALKRQLEILKGPYVSGAEQRQYTADEPSGMTGGESKQKEDSPPVRGLMDSSLGQMVDEDSGAMPLFIPENASVHCSGKTHGGRNNSSNLASSFNVQLTTHEIEQTISQQHGRKDSTPQRQHGAYRHVDKISTEVRPPSAPNQMHEKKRFATNDVISRIEHDSDRRQYQRGVFEPSARMINSPTKVQIIDYLTNKSAVDEIIDHLNIAIDLRMNNNAIYDKGLLLRQTNQAEAALKVFKILVRNEHRRCSLVVLANAFEQAGYCLQELLASPNSKNKENDEEDMKMYFKKSLEISCNIVAKLPELENCWDSAPILKSFLLGKPKTKQNLKDRSFLYEKMKDYEKNLDVLSRLRIEVDTEEEHADICKKIIDQYFKMKRFDDAVLTLQILMCHPKLHDHLEQKLFIEVYIEGAFDAFKKGYKNVARLRFDNAFDFSRRQYKMSEVIDDGCGGLDRETSKMNFSILILCNPDHEDNAVKILQVLQLLGVRTTLNNHETMEFGKLKTDVFAESVLLAKHFLVVYDFEPSSKENDRKLMRNVEMMTKIVLDRGHGNVLTLVSPKTKPSNVPRSLSTRKKIVYNFEAEQDIMTGDVDNIKNILVCLATDETK